VECAYPDCPLLVFKQFTQLRGLDVADSSLDILVRAATYFTAPSTVFAQRHALFFLHSVPYINYYLF
jgi:hypothetical protein